jgi:hypothetical protein
MLVKSSERGREDQSRVGVIYGGAARLEVAAGRKASNMLVQWPEKSSMAMEAVWRQRKWYVKIQRRRNWGDKVSG